MFDYTVQDTQLGGNVTVWSQLPLQALAPGVLTPFSFSTLSELLRRAWYQYYARLGFAPIPRTRLLRQHNGRAYLNLTVSARLEAEQAGIEPLTLSINGQPYPLAPFIKAGFLAGFKLGRTQQKIDDTLVSLGKEVDTVVAKAEAWHAKTLDMRWTQADILLIMEEIERAGIDSMIAFVAARHNLALTYSHLITATRDALGYPANLAVINAALADAQGLVEADIATAIATLGDAARGNDAVIAWLHTGDPAHPDALPDPTLAAELTTFLSHYGHRTLGEGESSRPRWSEAPQPVFAAILACTQSQARQPDPAAAQAQQKLMATFGSRHKAGRELLTRAAALHRLQSRALHAFAWVLAGTRRWALAAAREAMADHRLHAREEIFFFELEEIKQMMTGEWNVSDRTDIHATAARRQAEYIGWRQLTAPALLFGDSPGHPSAKGLPGVYGHGIGTIQCIEADASALTPGAIFGDIALDSGHALLLPFAGGFACAGGAPYDPAVIAAQPWNTPAVVGLDDLYPTLCNGAVTAVDGDAGTVTQPGAN